MIVKSIDELISQCRLLKEVDINTDTHKYLSVDLELSSENYLLLSKDINYYNMVVYMSNFALSDLENTKLVEFADELKTSGFGTYNKKLEEYGDVILDHLDSFHMKYSLPRAGDNLYWYVNLDPIKPMSEWIKWHKFCYENCVIEILECFFADVELQIRNKVVFQHKFNRFLTVLSIARANMLFCKEYEDIKGPEQRTILLDKSIKLVLNDLCCIIKSEAKRLATLGQDYS